MAKSKAKTNTAPQATAEVKDPGTAPDTTPERAEAVQQLIGSLTEGELRDVAMEMAKAYVDAHANWMAAEEANRQFEEANNALQEQLANKQDALKADNDAELATAKARITELENELSAEKDTTAKLHGYAKELENVKYDSMGIRKPAGL